MGLGHASPQSCHHGVASKYGCLHSLPGSLTRYVRSRPWLPKVQSQHAGRDCPAASILRLPGRVPISPAGPGPCSQPSHHPSTLGIVKSDPKLPDDAIFPLPPPRPKNVIFEDEEKSKVRLQGGVDEGSRARLGVRECQPLVFLPLEQRLRIVMATVLGDRHRWLSSYCMLPVQCPCV